MKLNRIYTYPLMALMLFASIPCCWAFGGQGVETPQPTVTEAPRFPEQPLTIEEPGGAVLMVGAGALSEDIEPALEDIGEGSPFAAGSPFNPASPEYFVDLRDAEQVGSIRLKVPLNGNAKDGSAAQPVEYVAWTEPEEGFPSVVGVQVVDSMATFPIVGTGKYQLFQLIAHEALMQMVSIFDPLAVPTYPQRTPAWCSPTAMTNLVNYHQGAWPVGGFGSVWGESSNWYLAGKAGQPFNKGYFFHWLLGAGGYTVPADVKQSFSNGNVEVIIWNWKAAVYDELWDILDLTEEFVDYTFANALFNSFQSYVEHFVWGIIEARRPVAWGSSLAGHSRTITGSSGTEFFFNDPGSGSLNSSQSWADYRMAVIESLTAEKVEVIDTVVFHAEPRPESQRRGVIWLLPRKDDGFPGSVALIDGGTGQPATEWYWDGDLGHENGYYYEDLRGVLPVDPVFDVQFKALTYLDEVEYGFAVFNITPLAHDFHVDVVLQNENFSVLENVGMFDMQVAAGTRTNLFPAEGFRIYDLPPGLYTLKFVLLHDGAYQDVKYVQFRVAESDLLGFKPYIELVHDAFCHAGDATAFGAVAEFAAGRRLDLVGVNRDRTWGKIEATEDERTLLCWIPLSEAEVFGVELVPVLESEPVPTEAPTRPVCVSTLDRASCNAAGGVFVPGFAPYCRCP